MIESGVYLSEIRASLSQAVSLYLSDVVVSEIVCWMTLLDVLLLSTFVDVIMCVEAVWVNYIFLAMILLSTLRVSLLSSLFTLQKNVKKYKQILYNK